jgi:hypothetical protein
VRRASPAASRAPSRLRRVRRPASRRRAPAPAQDRPVVEEAAPKRKPAPRKAVAGERHAATRVRGQAPPRARKRLRPRGSLFAEPATRELAFFVLAGLMIGAAIGALVALSG